MTAHAKGRPWRVLQQQSWCDDVEVCSHRFEMLADLCAIHRSYRANRSQIGVFYTVRRRQEES
jgi:hypothetical protein